MSGTIRLIALKDLREMRRDARLICALALFAALLLAAALGGWRHHQTVAREKAEAAHSERSRWLDLGQYNPHGAAHHGLYVFKQQGPLGFFDPGIEGFLGVGVWLEAHRQNDFVYRPLQDAAPVQRFSQLSPAMALQTLGPLVIILLAFSAFAGEREQGTLRQTLSLGIGGCRLLIGKAGAIAAVLVIALAPPMAVAVLAAWCSREPIPWARSSLLALVYLVYLSAFLGLGLAVSARARSARAALASLLAFWTITCFLAPRATAELAAWLYPLPSAVGWQAEMEAEIRASHAPASEAEVKRALFAEYGVDREEDLPVNWRGVMVQRDEEQNYPVFDRHFGRLFQRIRDQDAVYQWGGLAAPVLALQALSMGLAGSDFEHHRSFVRAAEDHRRIIQKTLNEELIRHPETDWGVYEAGPELWARVPPFRYEAPGLEVFPRHYFPAALALAAWFLAAWWAALRAAKAMRP
jgi:ABC-2 type transport system permease protein